MVVLSILCLSCLQGIPREDPHTLVDLLIRWPERQFVSDFNHPPSEHWSLSWICSNRQRTRQALGRNPSIFRLRREMGSLVAHWQQSMLRRQEVEWWHAWLPASPQRVHLYTWREASSLPRRFCDTVAAQISRLGAIFLFIKLKILIL